MRSSVERRWISPKDCSEYLGCHLMTVYAWIAAGMLPTARVGRSVKIDLKTLEAQLEAQAQGQAAGRGQK